MCFESAGGRAARTEGEYPLEIGGTTAAYVTPFARLQGATSTQNAFTENGANALNLSVAAQTTNFLRSVLGAQIGGSLDMGWRDRLAMRLRWSHEFADTGRAGHGSLCRRTGPGFHDLRRVAAARRRTARPRCQHRSSAPARSVAIVVAILAADIRVGRSDVKPTSAEPAMSRLPFLACVLLLSVGGGEAHGQPPPAAESAAAARARCAQLVEYWDRYSASKGEGGGNMDMPRKSAVSDCAAGRTEAGIRTMEDLLRRNGYAVPPP